MPVRTFGFTVNQAWLGVQASMNAPEIGLLTNSPSMGPQGAIDTVVEPAFAGYARKPLVLHSVVLDDVSGILTVTFKPVAWYCDQNGAGVVVTGWFINNNLGGATMFMGTDQISKSINDVDDGLSLQAVIHFNPLDPF